MSIALFNNTAAYSVQDGRVGVQVLAWYGFVLPIDILRPNVITRWSHDQCHLHSAVFGQLSMHNDKLRSSQLRY